MASTQVRHRIVRRARRVNELTLSSYLHEQVGSGKSGSFCSVASSSTLRCALSSTSVFAELTSSRTTRQWGMFIHDPDSNLCWFNPASHDLDEFYLVGVVVGLACYNAATLDVPLPQASFARKRVELCG